MAGHSQPSLTFGVEMEMLYVHEINDFQQLTGIRTGKGMKATAQQRRNYIASILRHRLPIGFGTPSLLGSISIDYTHSSDYTQWTVTEDASIGAGVDEISTQFNIPIDEAIQCLHWDQVELVSPVFRFRSQNLWLPQLQQVQADLSSRSHLGASFCNDSCGLHVHFAVESSKPHIPWDADTPPAFPIFVIQHLSILWAYWEGCIESLHPFWRHADYCEYAQSLLASSRGVEGLDSWPVWSAHIYSLQSSSELRGFLAGRHPSKFTKIYISPAREYKRETLEFREHRGTTDAREIRWWVVFIECVIQYCYKLAATDFRLFGPGSELWNVGYMEDIWRVIEMPAEGRNFLRGKIQEYASLDPADYYGVPRSDGTDTGGSMESNLNGQIAVGQMDDEGIVSKPSMTYAVKRQA